MLDRDKVIKDLKEYRDRDYIREGTNYFDNDPRYRRMIIDNALALLKEQDKRYAMMVVDWLRDMAHNNYLDLRHMTFLDAILDIRERAQTGLENYFMDYDFDIKQQEGR